jgi:hypothetical protein
LLSVALNLALQRYGALFGYPNFLFILLKINGFRIGFLIENDGVWPGFPFFVCFIGWKAVEK